MASESQIQSLMRSHGMTRQQAIAHNQSAVSQGMDLNGDGFVTGNEYLSWKQGARAGSGGGGNSQPQPQQQHQPTPQQQQAQERAQNYSQNQADAASAQQQYDQSIAEWESEFQKRDQQYTDDIKKMDEDYQKQFEDFERATALSMMDEGGSKKTYSKVKDNLLNQTDSYDKYNKFGDFDPTASHEQRKYSFNQ